MKHFFFLLIIMVCIAVPDIPAQRYLPGQKGLQATFGTVNGFNLNTESPDFAFHSGIAFSTYLKNGNRWLLGGEFLQKFYPYRDIRLPQAQFTAEGGYYYKFLSDAGKTVFFSLGASVLGGYETVNGDKKLLFDGATIENKNAFLYGGAITLESEIFLNDRIILLVNVRERFLEGSSIGKLNTVFGLGVKYIIN